MTSAVVWQFSTQNDLSGYLIRYGTRSRWTHVDAVLPDGSLLGSTLDGGVQIRPPTYAKFSETLTTYIETDCADRFYEKLHSQIGKPYDWRAIISFGLGERDWRETDSWFCSELQIWAMEQAGFFDRQLLVQENRLSPRDQLLLFSPWIVLIG